MLTNLKILLARHFFAILFFTLALISFFHHSPLFTPFLGGDTGVHLLMSVNFDFTTDFYYWGQDRLGSFVPMVSHIIYLLFKSNHIFIISIVQYSILCFGAYYFTKFFDNTFSKIIFCILWFFPLHSFINLVQVGMPQGVSLSFLIAGIYYYKHHNKTIKLIAFLLFFISIWVSDLSLISIIIYLGITHIILYKREGLKTSIKSLTTSSIGLSIIVGIIYLFKRHSEKSERYNEIIFNNYDEVAYVLKEIYSNLYNVLFEFNELNSLIIAFSILIIVTIVYARKKILESSIGMFFLANLLFTLFICLISHWVFLNDIPSRYFVDSYVSFIFLACYLVAKNYKILFSVFAITSIFSSVELHYESFDKKTSVVSSLHEFNSLGSCSLIGSYWYTYEISSIFPEKIIGIPHDGATIRNKKEIKMAFNSPKIYLNSYAWLSSFPDTTNQYGYKLIKKGVPFKIKQFTLCEYVVVKAPNI